jgi:fimbrial isopeptide formation D2 family protein/LPXTG-motif cell wall-anchored protein
MSKLTKRMRGVLAAAFAAVLAVAMAIAPGTAYADSATTIGGLESGDSVTVYQVASYDSDTGQYVWNVTDSSSLPSLQSTEISMTDTQWKYLYDHVTDTGVTSYGPVSAADSDGDGTYTASFTLPKGLYVAIVTNSSDSSQVYQNNVFAVTSDTDATSVTLKSSDITPVKTVDKSNVAVGETATYTITSTVPTYDSNATDRTYQIIDVLPDGLTYVDGSVTVADSNGSILDYVDVTSTVNDDGTTTVTIDLSDIVTSNDTYTLTAGDTVTVTLQATRDADSDQVEVNQTYVNYSKDSYGSDTTTTPPDEVPVYDFSIVLTKVDSEDNTETLSGAKFTLSTTVTNEDGSTSTKYVQADGSLGDTAYEFTTDSNGQINFVGLAEGTYTLHETQAPADHVLPSSDMTITITAGEADSDGNISTWTLSDGTNTTTYTVDNSAATITLEGEVTVENTPTGSLPETGEAGTVALTVAGIGLVAVACGWAVRNHKKDNA